MNGQKCLGYSVAYGQVQVDLITKVHGLEQAEKYFDNLPNSLRPWQGYIVLLNCYAKEKLLAKAEAVMQKFRELHYAKPLPYNIMLGLYSQLRKHAELDYLVQEMEEKDIRDKVTYNIRLNISVASSNIEQMEKLLMRMEVDPMVTIDWRSYSIAANGYLNAGASDKARAALRKAEHLIKVDTSSSPYDFLLTLYARAGKKDDVHRMWNLQKETRKFSNRSYLSMMSALTMLDDLDGAEKILDEWEARHTYFEHRIPNFLISIYSNKGKVRKAGSILNRLIKNGKKPDSCAWSHMALGYLQVNQMDKVVETTKEAIVASHPGWRSNFPTLVAACLKHLEEKGDVDKAEEIVRLIEKKAVLSMHSTKKLVKYWGNKELAQRLNILWEGQQT